MDKRLHLFTLPRDELHESLGGGFPKGSLILIEGEDGSGKSALCQRFAYGFAENNISVTIVSTELTAKGFISQMYSLDYPIATYLLNNKMLYIPVYPLMGKAKSRKDFIGRFMNAKGIFEKDVIIIDSFSSLVKNSLSGEERCIEVLSLIKKLCGADKTFILTIEPYSLNEEALSMFKSSADIYFSLQIITIGTYINHVIRVNRFTQTENRVEDMIGFRIEPSVGLIVEITSYG